LIRTFSLSIIVLTGLAFTSASVRAQAVQRPNILWIYIEDMNPFLGCYGDSTVPTPNMDGLASQGVLFEKCFVTAPVCSPCRSAIITGRMQTTIGAHNHNSAYNKTTPVLLPDYLRGNTLPEIFRKNGYSTFNQGKDHYNFTYDRSKLYSMQRVKKNWKAPWRELKDRKKPFFGQVQLSGGKYAFNPKSLDVLPKRLKPEDVADKMPPYYPKDPIMLKHWALHYDCVRRTDMAVGEVMQLLENDGLLENTIVFCFSDHGCYLPRHKQFCYEGGLQVPFIVVAPEKYAKWDKGVRRKGLISALDISATSLALSGIEVPKWYDSRDLFALGYKRDFVIAAKDRMDFTIDRVRSLRNDKGIKYIRNFMTDRPYMQLNYRHGREYMNRMQELFTKGKLTEEQARFWGKDRPAEELYDLNKDPHELRNLADSPKYRQQLQQLRAQLDEWIKKTNDKGQYPEDEPNLRHTYKIWGDARCVNPEYDRFRLPKVLIIGDSISNGYMPYVQKTLKEKAVVIHNRGNAQHTATGLRMLDSWLGDTKWDVIHFNWGLGDMYGWRFSKDGLSPGLYEKRLEKLVIRLKKTEARLVWGTTTPICPEAEKTMRNNFKREVRINPAVEQQYLDAALRVMKKHNIRVNDLHALIAPELKKYARAADNVHYTDKGYEKLGKQVAASIEKILPGQK